MTPVRPRSVLNPAGYLLGCTLITCLLIVQGADFKQYRLWGRVIAYADLEKIPTLARSELGAPYFQWSAGPGMLFAAPYWALPDKIAEGACLVISALLAASFWYAFYQGLALLTCDRIAAMTCLLAFIATPLGYASVTASSETQALFPIGLLFLETVRRLKLGRCSLLTVAASTGMLLLFRPYWGAYAWPALLVCVLSPPVRALNVVWRTFVVAAFIAVSVWPGFTTNYWMTGDPLHTPYRFGDAEFQSLDPSCPYLNYVLFDTFHGAFPTHPCLVVSAVLACVLTPWIARRAGVMAAAAWGIGLLALAINVYVAGCWYYWWMATHFSLGNRAFVLTSIQPMVAIALVSHWLEPRVMNLVSPQAERQMAAEQPIAASTTSLTAGVRRVGVLPTAASWIWAAVLMFAVLWSFLLLSQGPMDYLTWSKMAQGQLVEIKYWTQPSLLPIWFIAVSFAATSFGPFLREAAIALRLQVMVYGTLVVAYLLDRSSAYYPGLIAVYVAVGIFGMYLNVSNQRRLAAAMRGWTSFGAPTCLAIMLASFLPLWLRTKLPKPLPPGGYVVQSQPLESFQAHGVLVAIPRFSEQADRLGAYLKRQAAAANQEVKLLTPEDPPMFVFESEPRTDAWMDRRSRERLKHR